MLLARSGQPDAVDATAACLDGDGNDILTSDIPADLRALAEAAGSTLTSSPSEPPGSRT